MEAEVHGFDSVHLAIERLSTDATGACWQEPVGTHEGRRFSRLVAVDPAMPTGAMQLVATGEAGRWLLTGLLGLASPGANPRQVGRSRCFLAVPVDGDPREIKSQCTAWRIFHRGNRPHPDVDVKLDVLSRRLELYIQDPRTVATLAE